MILHSIPNPFLYFYFFYIVGQGSGPILLATQLLAIWAMFLALYLT